jgi:hypothetical protein
MINRKIIFTFYDIAHPTISTTERLLSDIKKPRNVAVPGLGTSDLDKSG